MPGGGVADCGLGGGRTGGERGCACRAQVGQGSQSGMSWPRQGLAAGAIGGAAAGGAGRGSAGTGRHGHGDGLCWWMRRPIIGALRERTKSLLGHQPRTAPPVTLMIESAPILLPREFDDNAMAPKSVDDRIYRDSIIKTACRPCRHARSGADRAAWRVRLCRREGCVGVRGVVWCGRRESNPHGQKPGRF